MTSGSDFILFVVKVLAAQVQDNTFSLTWAAQYVSLIFGAALRAICSFSNKSVRTHGPIA